MSGNSLTIKNNQGWQIQLLPLEGEGSQFKLFDNWRQSPQEKVVFLLTQVQVIEVNQSFSTLLAQRVKKLFDQNNKFGFQVHKHEGAIWVVFGPYGLLGAGRIGGMLTSAAEATTGAVLVGTGLAPVSGSMLISAGVSSGLYAYRANEQNYSNTEYLKNTGLGGVSGLISGGFTHANLAASFFKGKVLGSLFNSTLSNIGNVCLYATADRKEMTARRAFSLFAGGIFGTGASHVTGAAFSGVLGEVGDDLVLGIVRGGVEGSSSGGTAAAVATIVANGLEGKKWNHNLSDTFLVGAFVGGISGGSKNAKEILAKYRESSIASQSKKIGNDLDALDDQASKEVDQLIDQIDKVDGAKRNFYEVVEKAYKHELQKKALLAEIDQIKGNNPQDPTLADKQSQLKQMDAVSENFSQEFDQRFSEWGESQNAYNEQWNDFKKTYGQLRELNNALNVVSMGKPLGVPLDSLVPFNNLEKIFAISPVARVEATEDDWYELAKHIVLVHAITADSALNYHSDELGRLGEEGFNLFIIDQVRVNSFVLEKNLSKNGEMGSHLDFQKQQFRGNLVQRPHLHWSWNQLVQKHGPVKDKGIHDLPLDHPEKKFKNSWEGSVIAVLEPMGVFEHPGSNEAVFGIAPYDTMTMGKHRLSERSIVLVPPEIEENAREYMTDFKGQIISYPSGPIRKSIFDAIQHYYPDVWHIVDPLSGKKLGAEEYPTQLGYSSVTCLEKQDGSRLTLITNTGKSDAEIKSLAMLHGKKMGKFIGLHDSSDTVMLDDDHRDFNELKDFKKNQLRNVRKPVFVGYDVEDRDISNLVILKSFKFRKDMSKFAPSTQAWVVGDYVYYEALHADIISVLSANFPAYPLDFTPHELNAIISRHGDHLFHILEALDSNTRNQDLSKRHFEQYRSLLLKGVQSMMRAREVLSASLDNENSAIPGYIQLIIDGSSLENEWRRLYSNGIERNDFDKRWPLSQQEKEFLLAVRNLLPYDIVELTSALNAVREQIEAIVEGEEKDKFRYLEYSLKLYLKEIYFLSDDQEVSDVIGSFPYGLHYLEKTLQIGNSLFDNVAYQLQPSISAQELKVQSTLLREKSLNHMRNHPERFQEFFGGSGELKVGSGLERYRYSNWDEYLAGLARDNVWADELVLKAVSESTDCPLVKLRPGQASAPSVYHAEGRGHPLFIAHVQGQQFASLRPTLDTTLQEIFSSI